MTTKRDLIIYLHRAAFSPVVSTWTKAIDAGFFTTWPGLTSDLVRKHLPKSLATAKGHLKQSPKNLRSTKLPALPPTPPPDEPRTRTNLVFLNVTEITGKVSTDQTGRFPHVSSRGSKYLMVLYDHDSNAILAEPIKSRSESELLRAYTKLHAYLSERGLKPSFQMLDNECPAALKKFMTANDINFQLVPPYLHHTNAAEKAIGIYKDHLIAGLSSCDPNFPMHLWDRIIPQATLTLNLLRFSRINPRLSAEAQLNGAFDFNRTPLAPPGTKVLVYDNPEKRRTWAAHGVDGWYIGSAPEHYRCYKVYIPKTRAERTAHTVEFFPHECPVPKTSSADAATDAARALADALANPAPAAPFARHGDAQMQAINELARIFTNTVQAAPSTTANAPAHSPRVAVPSPRVPTPAPATPSNSGYRLRSRYATAPLVAANLERTANKANAVIDTTTCQSPCDAQRKALAELTRIFITSMPAVQPRVPVPAPSPRVPTPSPVTPLVAADHERHAQANVVIDEATGQSLEYRHLSRGPDKAIWIQALANDLGRLAQGVGTRMPTGTNTIFFLPRASVPAGRVVTYGRLVSTIRPTKEEKNRVRVTVGGDKLPFPGITTTQCASLTTTKCLLNSTLSTPNAKFMTLDIKNFYYNTPMDRFEYMKLPLSLIPEEIILQYNLRDIEFDGMVYMEIRKGMPGLKQAGKIANDRLALHLAASGYFPVPRTPALWRHESKAVTFSLVVDDFGVKYVGKENADHLIQALKKMYTISIDWDGELFLGLTLKWDYYKRICDVSMPNYVDNALHKFQHDPPRRHQDAPHTWNKPVYGAAVQYATNDSQSPRLDAKAVNRVQQIVGTFLYYALAVDSTMLVALSSIGSEQSHATQQTLDDTTWLLDYAASHRDATIRYHASDMILHIHSDGSHLSETRARSRAGGHYFLSDRSADPSKPPLVPPKDNGAIHTLCKILKPVLASAAETEIAATFENGQEAVPIRTALLEMGHPQPATPMQVDNSTAVGFANNTIKQKRSKAIDMRFYWIQDRTLQKQFLVYWKPGSTNLGDYHTKHHSPSHHRDMRPTYLHPTTRLAHTVISHILRGCVISPVRAVSAHRSNPVPE
jgi:hypothetical protein